MYISITRMHTHFFSSSFTAIRFCNTKNSQHFDSRTAHPLSHRLCSSLIHAFQNLMLRNSSTWNSSQLLIALNDEIFKMRGAAGALSARSLAVSRFWRSNLEMWSVFWRGRGRGRGAITPTEDLEIVLQLEMCNIDTQLWAILLKY